MVVFSLCVAAVTNVCAQEVGASSVEFPYTGNRTAVWIVAQLHILFAAFILGAPIFVVISEWLGYRKQDPRYDRLAKEITKVTVILFSMTAVTGGLFIFVLLAAYPQFTTSFINQFYMVFAVLYPALFIAETILMYAYLYTWDVWKGEKKGRHIALGVLLNLVCLLILFVINGPTSFMNTPPKAEGVSPQDFIAAATLWDKIVPSESSSNRWECGVRRVYRRDDRRLYVHGGEDAGGKSLLRLDGLRRHLDRGGWVAVAAVHGALVGLRNVRLRFFVLPIHDGRSALHVF
jgi:hypothetical protein